MQVQALRSVEPHLALEKLYIMGTNCTDNGPREGLAKFLGAASERPETALHYEFMQDFRVRGCGRWRGAFLLLDRTAAHVSDMYSISYLSRGWGAHVHVL